MASISQGLVLTTAMVVSSTVLYLAFSRPKTFSQFQVSGNSTSLQSDKQILRSCLSSGKQTILFLLPQFFPSLMRKSFSFSLFVNLNFELNLQRKRKRKERRRRRRKWNLLIMWRNQVELPKNPEGSKTECRDFVEMKFQNSVKCQQTELLCIMEF